jgi:mannose/fructose/N-acetylgalactosamine-specific phosphotransferase system component IID
LSAGTYTGLIATVVGSTTSASTQTPVSTNFTISAAVPDLAYGFIPLMAILLVVYILLGRRVHPMSSSRSLTT